MPVAAALAAAAVKNVEGVEITMVLPLPQPFATSAVAVVKENTAEVAAVLAMRLAQAILMLTAVTVPLPFAGEIAPEAPQF